MKINYDTFYVKEKPSFRSTVVYSEELEAIENLIATNHQNVCFEYPSSSLAKAAYVSLKKLTDTNNIKVSIMRRKYKIYIEKC